MVRVIVAIGFFTVAVFNGFHSASAEDPHIRVVALVGDPVPGLSPPKTFEQFGSATLNDSGHVVISATTLDGRFGIWSDRSGSLSLFLSGGASLPGTSPGVQFALGGQSTLSINNEDEIAFRTRLQGGDVTQLSALGIWSDAGGALSKVVRQGDVSVPSAVTPLYYSCTNPQISLANGQLFCPIDPIDPVALFNDSGDLVFRSELCTVGPLATPPAPTPTTVKAGIWVNRAGSLQKIVASGDTAPGVTGKFDQFPEFLRDYTALNNNGDVAFSANTTSSSNSSIWLSRGNGSPNNLELMVKAGDSVNDVLPGLSLMSPRVEGINDAGAILFKSRLQGPGVGATNDDSLWLKTGAGLQLLAREGEPILGTSLTLGKSVGTANSIVSASVSGNGVAAFSGQLENGRGIFTVDSNGIHLIASSDMQPPGTGFGVTFDNFIGESGNVAINGAGQVAFLAFLSGNGVNSTNDRGLWVTDRAGQLRMVFRDGQQVEVRPGEFRTIDFATAFVSSGDQDGLPSAFNDSGEIAVFTDWGVYVSRVGTVPEPSRMALMVVGASFVAGLAIRRRFRK